MKPPAWRTGIVRDRTAGLGLTIRPVYLWDDRTGTSFEFRLWRFIATWTTRAARA